MRSLTSILALLAFPAFAAAQNYEPLINGFINRDYFRLTFQDEFDGNTLDSNKWTHTFTGKRWDATLVPEAVSVSGGNLTIKTWSEQSGSGLRHKSGVISTNGKFAQAYGFYEARIDFDSAPGTWSAFWVHSFNMTGNITGDLINRPDLVGAEMDVIEHRAVDQNGSDISNGGFHAVHWNGYGSAAEANGTMDWTSNLANGFHTFGMLWTRDRYDFYLDGYKTWSFTNPNGISSIPQVMILSTEVLSGNWAGLIPSGGFGSYAHSTAQFKVDYVRAYAINPDSPMMPEPTSLTCLLAASVLSRRRR